MRKPIIVVAILISLCSIVLASERTASYYTKESAQREGTSGVWTASGERYNENALTCAMRTREFGQKWKICNVDNNKCVEVINNDFGPNKKLYNKGRIVDLSKKAFESIANLDEGVINVTVVKCN